MGWTLANLIAPTWREVRKACEDIVSYLEPGAADFNRNNLKITLRNGTVIQGGKGTFFSRLLSTMLDY